MKRNIRIAFCGIVSAVISVIMLASLLPDVTFSVPAVAGLFLIPVFAELGGGWAVACFVTSSTASFFISDKTSWLLFAIFFGYYPILKPYIEKIKLQVIKWLLKVLIFNTAAAICYYVQMLVVGIKFTSRWLALIFIIGNIAFTLYDIAMSRIAVIYYLRLHKKISSILKNNGEG